MIATSAAPRRRTSAFVRRPRRALPWIVTSGPCGRERDRGPLNRARPRLRTGVAIGVIIRECPALCSVAERLDVPRARQPAQGPLLQPLHLPPWNSELATRVPDGRGLVSVDPVPKPHDLTLLVGQPRDRTPQGLLAEGHAHLLVRSRPIARQECPELGIPLRADRAVQAGHDPARAADPVELFRLDLRAFRDLIVGRLAAQFAGELALHAGDSAFALREIGGDANGAGPLLEGALHRLADPEGRVSGELVTAPPIELLGRPDQAEDSLLDQVEKREPLALVALRVGNDEAQVRVDQPLLGSQVAPPDALRQLDLLLLGEQRVAAGLVEEELECVGGRARELVGPVARGLDNVAPAVIAHVDAARFELLVESLGGLLGELERPHRLGELGQLDASLATAAHEQLAQRRVIEVELFPGSDHCASASSGGSSACSVPSTSSSSLSSNPSDSPPPPSETGRSASSADSSRWPPIEPASPAAAASFRTNTSSSR